MWILILGILFAIPVSFFAGKKLLPKIENHLDKKMIQDAERVVSGEKDNIYNYEGQKYPVNKFKFLDKDNNEEELIFEK